MIKNGLNFVPKLQYSTRAPKIGPIKALSSMPKQWKGVHRILDSKHKFQINLSDYEIHTKYWFRSHYKNVPNFDKKDSAKQMKMNLQVSYNLLSVLSP